MVSWMSLGVGLFLGLLTIAFWHWRAWQYRSSEKRIKSLLKEKITDMDISSISPSADSVTVRGVDVNTNEPVTRVVPILPTKFVTYEGGLYQDCLGASGCCDAYTPDCITLD